MADTPEQQARQTIDAMLAAAGWTVQDYKAFDPSASIGIALWEVPLKSGRFCRFVEGLNSGSLIQHMLTSQLAEFTFPIPPLAEQTRIVAEVERRLSVVEELDAVVTNNLQRATRLRQSVLQRAFSGSI